MNTKTITEKTIRALEDISNGYAPTPATGTADMAKIAAAVLGFLESDGNLGMTYDGNPEDPRSVAYDLGRALGHALEEK